MSQRVEGHVRTQRRVVRRPLPLVHPRVRGLHRVLVHPLHAVAPRHVVGQLPGVALLRPSVEYHSNGQVNVVLTRQHPVVQPQNGLVDQRRKVVQQAVSLNPLFPNWLAILGAISARHLRVRFHQIFVAARFLLRKPIVV